MSNKLSVHLALMWVVSGLTIWIIAMVVGTVDLKAQKFVETLLKIYICLLPLHSTLQAYAKHELTLKTTFVGFGWTAFLLCLVIAIW